MKTTRLILIGGFLGAGKTTLIWETASRLTKSGLKTGLVTNDQAPDLVDTALLKHQNLNIAEVSGSCFCCNFNGLKDALAQVNTNNDTDIIIAEPVGSCTDLSATILQPMKKMMQNQLVISPFTVLADPMKLEEVLGSKRYIMHPGAAYIFLKQLEESDIILITKTDILTPQQASEVVAKTKKRFPLSEVMAISSVTGAGIDEWLKVVTTSNEAGKRIAEVDYDIYADGEAVMGWLNASLSLHGKNINWEDFGEKLMRNLAMKFDGIHAPVGHVKIIIENGKNYFTGNLTGGTETLSFRGKCGTAGEVQMIINARVEMAPEQLDNIIRSEIAESAGNRITIAASSWKSLSPGRPNPTWRYSEVVPVWSET
jgi:Ni2+-binding GTPase involved in maturation of urease and hydrogenase